MSSTGRCEIDNVQPLHPSSQVGLQARDQRRPAACTRVHATRNPESRRYGDPTSVDRMAGCPECGFADLDVRGDPAAGPFTWQYDEGRYGSAGETIRSASEQIAEIVRSRSESLRLRSATDRWSPLEYACHVRDVLLIQRERLLKALRGHGNEVLPMGRDERVMDDGYNEQQPRNVAAQVEQAALMFIDLLQRLGPSDWDLEVAYLFPNASPRTLRWVAVHTAHEVVHHLHDIRDTTRS